MRGTLTVLVDDVEEVSYSSSCPSIVDRGAGMVCPRVRRRPHIGLGPPAVVIGVGQSGPQSRKPSPGVMAWMREFYLLRTRFMPLVKAPPGE